MIGDGFEISDAMGATHLFSQVGRCIFLDVPSQLQLRFITSRGGKFLRLIVGRPPWCAVLPTDGARHSHYHVGRLLAGRHI